MSAFQNQDTQCLQMSLASFYQQRKEDSAKGCMKKVKTFKEPWERKKHRVLKKIYILRLSSLKVKTLTMLQCEIRENNQQRSIV